MKKILSIVAIGALFTSYGFADSTTTTGTIGLTTVIPISGSVAFGEEADAYSNNNYKVKNKIVDSVTLELATQNQTIADMVVHLRTNDTLNNLKLTLDNPTGNLTNGTNNIPYICSYGVGSATPAEIPALGIALTSAHIDDTTIDNEVGHLKITASPSATQVAGTYIKTITATLSQN